jgi:UDP-N-acetylglucosamine--N-acetylmuramyl-(pentapeptide) pyrophosphoryl-undecaprenol N-acetylglucosamine transferase
MFPALALAREIEARGERVALITDARGARYIDAGMEHHIIRAGSPSGSPLQRLRGLASLGTGLVESLGLVRRLDPIAVASFGGYASAPAAVAALIRRVPVLVHEQNAVLGRANRLIGRRARVVALTFEATSGCTALDSSRMTVTGNPVRLGFLDGTAPAYRAAQPDGSLRLLVLGGSQGARVFSDVVPAAVAGLDERQRQILNIVQQCRPEDLQRVRTAYADIGVETTLASFFDDVPKHLAEAHLVITRSGASTVAELLAMGRPSILVPYPHAADDHQLANAEILVEARAALMVPDAACDAATLTGILRRCIDRPADLEAMAGKAHAMARPDAASAIADALIGLVRTAPAARLECA